MGQAIDLNEFAKTGALLPQLVDNHFFGFASFSQSLCDHQLVHTLIPGCALLLLHQFSCASVGPKPWYFVGSTLAPHCVRCSAGLTPNRLSCLVLICSMSSISRPF